MLSRELKEDLLAACKLHERAVSDYARCLEFNQIMANLMERLEEENEGVDGYDEVRGGA